MTAAPLHHSAHIILPPFGWSPRRGLNERLLMRLRRVSLFTQDPAERQEQNDVAEGKELLRGFTPMHYNIRLAIMICANVRRFLA
jgi:hypothetical protein